MLNNPIILILCYFMDIAFFYSFACSDGFSLKPTKAKVIATIIVAVLLSVIVLMGLRII